MFIYGIFDKQAKTYVNILTAVTDGTACRNVKMMLKEGSPYLDFADDFRLDKLCECNVNSGEIIPCLDKICEFATFID